MSYFSIYGNEAAWEIQEREVRADGEWKEFNSVKDDRRDVFILKIEQVDERTLRIFKKNSWTIDLIRRCENVYLCNVPHPAPENSTDTNSIRFVAIGI